MAKKDAESKKGEAAVKSGAAPSNAIQDQKLQKWLETVVAILLGLTTLVSAWASWIGSLHSGIQSINFTKSNNMASRGTAEYNKYPDCWKVKCRSWSIWRTVCMSVLSDRMMRCVSFRMPFVVHVPVCRIRTVRSVPSSSSVLPASGKPSWLGLWLSSSLMMNGLWSASI